MSTWTATVTSPARPAAVLDALTDPARCLRWAPVDVRVSGVGDRLRAGSRACVRGRLAGREVGFDVEVHLAEDRQLALTAHGPLALDVRYDLVPVGDGSEVRARVAVRPGAGLGGRLLARATDALLAAGLLDAAVARLAAEATAAPR